MKKKPNWDYIVSMIISLGAIIWFLITFTNMDK